MQQVQDVIIVGGGPAGYTAALYTARANLSPLVFEGFQWGGLLQQTTDVENYPGFPEGIMGPELMSRMREQAERFGARLESEDVTEIVFSVTAGEPHLVCVDDQEHRAWAVIVATGATPRTLGVPGEQELAGRGVSYCATCDAAFFRDRKIVVVGGGDSAFEEAIFLSKFGSDVTLVHRRDEFRASKVMVQRALQVPNLKLKTPWAVVEAVGSDAGALAALELENVQSGERERIDADGLFVAVGHLPQSELVAEQLDLDPDGFVIVRPGTTLTGVPGVFACGDLVDREYRQAITAAGSGCQAALDCERYLRDRL